ncbi:MAG: putative negative regulator of RcsB-dependent stress response, partial [Planctomycetota bacterium]
LVESFATDDGKAELSAAKKLAKIIKNMRKGKLEKAPKALKKLIAKIGQTSVGARASRMLAALEG